MTEFKPGMLVGMGNPLLDILASVENGFLEKYHLKPNDAILADERHANLYHELVDEHNPQYIAGGATQNVLRVFQFIVDKPGVAIFMGCVGKDKFGTILEKVARESGVNCCYQYSDNTPTGTCAVLVTNHGKCRSLCANLAAANCFTVDHIEKPENMKLIEEAKFYYVSGFFLTVSVESILTVTKHASENKKIFALNLSAPFLCSVFKDNMLKVLPYADILFGNEAEANEFCKANNLDADPTDVEAIAKICAKWPKVRTDVERLVVFTQGEHPVIVVQGGVVYKFEVKRLAPEEIVDTNGAGDAFCGGFMAAYVLGKPIDVCVHNGINSARMIIQQNGCSFPDRSTFKFID